MPVKSLLEIATAAVLKNIRELQGVGDFLPYENIRHILLKVDNAQQLRQIELNSPQIEGETGEIWLKIIAKDFPMEYKAKAYKPQNPKKWYRVWEKYKKDHDSAIEESEKKLMSALAGYQETKEKNTSKILDRTLLPRAGRVGPRRAGFGQRDTRTSTLNFTQGSRTKTANGASVMRKVRRETKEIASIHGALSRPVRGPAGLTKINKAPSAMVNDHRRAAQPAYRPTKPEPSSAVTEYEERATFLSDSEDDEDHDPLFDDGEGKPAPSPAPKTGARLAATSLLKSKRPATGASASKSPVKSQASASATTKRSGILSNSYKGSISKPSSSVSPPRKASPPEDCTRPEPAKVSQSLSRTQASPPPTSTARASSPPPHPAAAAAAAAAPPLMTITRKRKAVDIFMKPKKRA